MGEEILGSFTQNWILLPVAAIIVRTAHHFEEDTMTKMAMLVYQADWDLTPLFTSVLPH